MANGGKFDWIGKNYNINGRKMSGVHSINPHNLKVGDKVSISVASGDPQYNGEFEVIHIGDDVTDEYKESIFVVDVDMNPAYYKEATVGTWEKKEKKDGILDVFDHVVDKISPHKTTNNGGSNTTVIKSNVNYTPLYIAGGLVVVAFIYSLTQKK